MFEDKDIICFLGDSITANGMWMAEVYQSLRRRHKVKCYNCGVSGATAEKAMLYLYGHCLSFNPDYVVMMFGINDIDRSLYADAQGREAAKKAAIQAHKAAYEKLVEQIIAFGSRVILCVAVPYDEVNDKKEQNLYCKCAMDELGEFVRSLADKYGCALVDFQSVMKPLLTERNLIGEDRIHPTDEGYHAMAQIFLRDIGEQEICDFDTPFVFEGWNKERYEAELSLNTVNYIKYNVLLKEGYIDKRTYEECKKIAAERYAECEDKVGYVAASLSDYIKKNDTYDIYMGEIIKRTLF